MNAYYFTAIVLILFDMATTLLTDPIPAENRSWVTNWYDNRNPVVRGVIKGLLIAIASVLLVDSAYPFIAENIVYGTVEERLYGFGVIVINVGLGASLGKVVTNRNWRMVR